MQESNINLPVLGLDSLQCWHCGLGAEALSERSMQMWLDGADLQLEASSFAESATTLGGKVGSVAV